MEDTCALRKTPDGLFVHITLASGYGKSVELTVDTMLSRVLKELNWCRLMLFRKTWEPI